MVRTIARAGPGSCGAKLLVLVVDGLDEAGKLPRRRANGPDRFLVVHPDGSQQAHRTEHAVREPICRADEREVAKARLLELVAEPDERPVRVERPAEQRE